MYSNMTARNYISTRNDGRSNGCIFHWRIENLSNCYWLEEGVPLVSPTFIADAFNGTKWSLLFYPRGENVDDYVGFFLCREDDEGPNIVEVNYHLAILDRYGTFLKGFYHRYGFQRDCDMHGRVDFETQERIFRTERKEFLPNDVLTVQCTLRKTCEPSINFKHIYARSVSKVNRSSVLWKIDKYSTVESSFRKKFKDSLIELDLILNKEIFNMDVISCDNTIKFISIHISIIDSEGKRIYCADIESNGRRIPDTMFCKGLVEYGKFEGTTHIFSQFPPRWKKHKSRYLPNDVLSLVIEYVFSTIKNSYDSFDDGLVSPKLTKEVVENVDKYYNGKEKSQNTSVLIDDLKSMYTNGTLSDTKLHTSSQTFSVHSVILSARSPVFSRMFSHDMKEKNSGRVHIADLENDTVHRMLLYIYTDSLEDLQFENASKLYAAADKYEILSLKSRCSSFLKHNMCSTNACDALILADSHHDEDLKSFVQAYILKHDDMFSLPEWKNLMEKNAKLAADIMYRKIHPCNA